MVNSAQKICVIGSKGLIGANFCEFLKSNNVLFQEIESSHFFYTQIKSLLESWGDSECVIVWAAGTSFPSNSHGLSDIVVEEELSAFKYMIAILENYSSKSHFIFMSSGGCIYSERSRPLVEIDELKPNNVYGEVKLIQESLLRNSSIRHTILRVSNVYGESKKPRTGRDIIETWIRNYNLGLTSFLYGDSSQFRDFINVRDVSAAIFRSIYMGAHDEVFNIGSGKALSLEGIANLFIECTEGRFRLELQEGRAIDRGGYVLDVSKARKSIGWTPIHSSEDNLKMYINNRVIK